MDYKEAFIKTCKELDKRYKSIEKRLKKLEPKTEEQKKTTESLLGYIEILMEYKNLSHTALLRSNINNLCFNLISVIDNKFYNDLYYILWDFGRLAEITEKVLQIKEEKEIEI